MFNVADLVAGDRYLIANERGEWQYSGCKGDKYQFCRKGIGTKRKVMIALSPTQVKRRVWRETTVLNLSNLEA